MWTMPQAASTGVFTTMKGSGQRWDSTYKTSRKPDTDELLRDEQARTQFERALDELGIRVI